MIKLTGLWKNVDKNGQSFLSGEISKSCRLMIFRNKAKRGEKDPEFEAFIVQSAPKERKPDVPKTVEEWA